MEASDRHGSTLERKLLAGRVREVQDDPALSAGEPRDDARGVQADLLVGMGAPPTWPPDWCGVSAAVSMVPLARRNRASFARMAVGHLRSWRAARRGRLVDGGLGPC